MNSANHLNARETPGGGLSGDPVFLESADAASWLDHEIGRNSPREKPANQPRHPKPNWLGRIFFAFLLLFFLLFVGVGAGLFFGRHWLMAQAETRALDALAKNGIHLAYDSARWEFPRGIVFSNVRLYENAGRESLILSASNMGLNQDLYSLARKRSIDAVNATVTFEDAILTLFHLGEEVAAFEQIDAYLTATAREITLHQFEGVFSGLAVEASGKVALGGGEAPAETPGDPAAAAIVVPRTLGERLDFGPVGGLRQWLAVSSESGEAPHLELTFLIPEGPDRKIEAKGRLWGRSFAWREVPVDSLLGEFSYNGADRVLDVPQMNLVYRGAPIDGRGIAMRLAEKRVEIGSLQSEADLVDLISTVDPDLAEKFAAIESVDAPEAGVSGVLDLADFWKSDLTIDYSHQGGMRFDVRGRKLPVRAVKSRFTVRDGTISTGNFDGVVLDGGVRGSILMRKEAEGIQYAADLKVSDLPLQSLAGLAGSDKPMLGVLNGTFKGNGAAELKRLNGAGELHIAGEDLKKVPVMGEIQDLMGTVAPIFGTPKKSTLDATYAITDGVFRTEDLEAVSDGIRIKAAGTCQLTDQMVAARAHGFLDGLAGMPTELIGKALEVSVEGPVDDLKTRFDNAPAAFSSDAAKAAFAAMGSTADAVKSLAGEGLKKPADALTKAAAAGGPKGTAAEPGGGAAGAKPGGADAAGAEAISGLLEGAKKLTDALKNQPGPATGDAGKPAGEPAKPAPPETVFPAAAGDAPAAAKPSGAAAVTPVGPPPPGAEMTEPVAKKKPASAEQGAAVAQKPEEEEKKEEPAAAPKKKVLRAIPIQPSKGTSPPIFRD